MTTPAPQDPARNRAAYEALEPALATWRQTVEAKFAASRTCTHEWRTISNVEVCRKCAQPRKLEEQQNED